MKMLENIDKEERKMLNAISWRSFVLHADRMGPTKYHASGFAFSMLPVIRRFYKTDKEQADALVRHVSWFNSTPHAENLILGIVASMEKERSLRNDFDDQSITAVKASLMGPLAGIGDTFFQGILRVIAASIGISLSMEGSVLGPILFLLIYNIPAVFLSFYLTYAGYSLGSTFIERIYSSGGMKILTKSASTLGLMMMGCMTATNVKFNTILQIKIGDGDPILIQTYLDQLFKGLIPLLVTLGCLYLFRKRVNINWVMLGIFVVSVVLGLIGVV